MLTKERETKLLGIGFIFDGKQAQAVRDACEAAMVQGGQLSINSFSDEQSNGGDGERDEAPKELTVQAEEAWEERFAKLCEYKALYGHACPKICNSGPGFKNASSLDQEAGNFAHGQRARFKVSA